MSYFGYAGEHITEDGGEYRNGIEFSLVQTKILEPGALEEPPVFTFHAYMSEVILADIFSGDWYMVELYDQYIPDSFEGGLYLPSKEDEASLQSTPAYAKLSPLPDSVADMLIKFYTAPASKYTFEEERASANANEPIGMVTFYDVGQALCVGVKTRNQDGTDADPLVFFDFGIPHRAGHPLPEQAGDFAGIVRVVDNLTSLGFHIKIILSHWHLDHTLIFLSINQQSFRNIRIYAPDRLVPSVMSIYNYVRQHVLPSEFLISNREFADSALYTNKNIILSKTNGARGLPMRRQHIHHYCYCMEVKLVSGENILLTGDGTYALYLPLTKNKQYSGLQASHHGGDFAVNLTPQQADIPNPRGGAYIIYSYGPNSYGHPDPDFVSMHTSAGWTQSFNTFGGRIDFT